MAEPVAELHAITAELESLYPGRRVEIKATYGDSGIGIRATSSDNADVLVVLRLPKSPADDVEIIYNGPFSTVRAVLGRVQSNGASQIRLNRLRMLQASVAPADQVPLR